MQYATQTVLDTLTNIIALIETASTGRKVADRKAAAAQARVDGRALYTMIQRNAKQAPAATKSAKPTKSATKPTKATVVGQCGKCGGDGLYEWENASGDMSSGTCYACMGKGKLTEIDVRRNANYRKHAQDRYNGNTTPVPAPAPSIEALVATAVAAALATA